MKLAVIFASCVKIRVKCRVSVQEPARVVRTPAGWTGASTAKPGNSGKANNYIFTKAAGCVPAVFLYI